MATMNISLPDQMRNWVQEKIDEGLYASSSDYVRDLIRKDQQRNDKIKALQAAIDKGLASGIAEDFDMSKLQRELDQE